MKILKHNAGALTNFEVAAFLRSRGASKDPSRVMAPIALSEFKVYDYLLESAACNQTRENIDEFLEKSKPYGLAKAELVNIINIRPSSTAQLYPILEQPESRLGEEKLEELVEMVIQVLPAPPTISNFQEVNITNEDVAAETGGEQMEVS